MSGYSAEVIIESYIDNDKYSELLKNKVIEYETLCTKNELTVEELDKL